MVVNGARFSIKNVKNPNLKLKKKLNIFLSKISSMFFYVLKSNDKSIAIYRQLVCFPMVSSFSLLMLSLLLFAFFILVFAVVWGILVSSSNEFNHDSAMFRVWYDRHRLQIRNACVLCSGIKQRKKENSHINKLFYN